MMFQFRDRRVLGEYACWVGDEMGIAVAAETEEIADEALKLIDIEWETSPFVLDPIEAMKKGRAAGACRSFHDQRTAA